MCFPLSDADRVSNLSVCYSTTGLHFTSATQMYTLDMSISWNEPNHTNGDITFYEVTVAQTFNSNNIVYNNNSLETSVTESVMVLPFTNYTVTVTVYTSTGQGEATTITFESPEAREDHVIPTYTQAYPKCHIH